MTGRGEPALHPEGHNRVTAQPFPLNPATVGWTCKSQTLTCRFRCTVWLVFAGVAATEAENVHGPLVTGLKFIHSTVADAQ